MIYADYVIYELHRAMALLRIGFLKVSKDNSDEEIMMRATHQVLESLLDNIHRQMNR